MPNLQPSKYHMGSACLPGGTKISAPFFGSLHGGTALKVDASARITVSPVFVEGATIQMFLSIHVICAVFWCTRAVNGRLRTLLVVMIPVGCLLFPLVHSMRKSCLRKQEFIRRLETFDVKTVECLLESDRASIHAALSSWYGSVDNFSEYVRGPFRNEAGHGRFFDSYPVTFLNCYNELCRVWGLRSYRGYMWSRIRVSTYGLLRPSITL